MVDRSNAAATTDRRGDRWADERDERTAARRRMDQETREAQAGWLATLAPWDIYATLTYDPRRWWDPHKAPSQSATVHHFHTFIRQADEALRRPILAVGASEHTTLGWPHWHAMIATGGLDERSFAELSSVWFDAHGYAKFYRVRDGAALPIAAYVSKYLNKRSTDVEIVQSRPGEWGSLQWAMGKRPILSVPSLPSR